MVRLKAIVLGVGLALAAAPVAALDLGGLGSILQGAAGGGGGGSSGLDIGRVITAAQGLGDVSPEQEEAIGMEASAVLLGSAGLYRNQAVQRYVNRVGRWVALQSERPDLRWRFAVLDTDSVNSFAAPGGYVFITKGLLSKLRNEAELAGVLAHECVHVVEKHYLAGVKNKAGIDLLLAVGSAAAKTDRSVTDRVSNGFKELYARGLDKGDEYEADAKAMVLAARAGYDPFGLPSALQTLAAISSSDANLAYMFKTHPTPDNRLAELESTMTAMERYASQPTLADRFHRAAAGK